MVSVSREGYTAVSCDYCGCSIDYVPIAKGITVDAFIRQSGSIVSKHGDFCDGNCLSRYKDNGNASKGCSND